MPEQNTPANPATGGSWSRNPTTGELTAVQQPEPATPALRAEAQADEQAAAAGKPAAKPATQTKG